MHLFYTHGLDGTLRAQPEIEEVFTPLSFTDRVMVFHTSSSLNDSGKKMNIYYGSNPIHSR